MRARRRPSRRSPIAVSALLGFVLAGCGTDFHPGAAAVVNGHVISESRVDDLVLAACEYSRAVRLDQGGAEPTQSMAVLRSSLAEALINFELTDEAATRLGLKVSDASIAELTSANSMPPGLSSKARDILSGFFYDASRAQLQQAVLGAHLRDPQITMTDDVTAEDIDTAAPYLERFADRQDVSVDPSYGSWDGHALVTSSGSLSDPVSTTPTPDPSATGAESVADLPPSQVCG